MEQERIDELEMLIIRAENVTYLDDNIAVSNALEAGQELLAEVERLQKRCKALECAIMDSDTDCDATCKYSETDEYDYPCDECVDCDRWEFDQKRFEVE